MAEYETVAVPFVTIGNRRGLTAMQIVEHEYLAKLVRMFPDSFEYHPLADVMLFIEPDIDDAAHS